jgi:hypothetical protein
MLVFLHKWQFYRKRLTLIEQKLNTKRVIVNWCENMFANILKLFPWFFSTLCRVPSHDCAYRYLRRNIFCGGCNLMFPYQVKQETFRQISKDQNQQNHVCINFVTSTNPWIAVTLPFVTRCISYITAFYLKKESISTDMSFHVKILRCSLLCCNYVIGRKWWYFFMAFRNLPVKYQFFRCLQKGNPRSLPLMKVL